MESQYGWICTGNLLVLSVCINEISWNREHESLWQDRKTFWMKPVMQYLWSWSWYHPVADRGGGYKAAVETVAENALTKSHSTDALYGNRRRVVDAFHKGINTMDSKCCQVRMINIQYFVCCAAKLDDGQLWLHSRAWDFQDGWWWCPAFVKMDVKNAAKICLQRQKEQCQPQLCTQREAAMAGVLEVQFAGSQLPLLFSEKPERNQTIGERGEMESACGRWRISDVPIVCFMQQRSWGCDISSSDLKQVVLILFL